MKLKAAEEANIDCELVHLPDDISESELLYKVYEYNNDPSVHGILVQLPLPDDHVHLPAQAGVGEQFLDVQ